MRARLGEPIQNVYISKSMRPNLQTGDYGAIRPSAGRGLLAVVQNPFLHMDQNGDTFSIGYKPDLAWETRYGPFTSDRGLLAPYGMSGRVQTSQMIPEWRLNPHSRSRPEWTMPRSTHSRGWCVPSSCTSRTGR